jgi:hypothetical protein
MLLNPEETSISQLEKYLDNNKNWINVPQKINCWLTQPDLLHESDKIKTDIDYYIK